MNNFDWKSISDKYYYYDTTTGKILGLASKIALHEIFFGVTYIGEYGHSIANECHLGQFISLDHAKKAIEFYWDVQNRTLLEG